MPSNFGGFVVNEEHGPKIIHNFVTSIDLVIHNTGEFSSKMRKKKCTNAERMNLQIWKNKTTGNNNHSIIGEHKPT